MIVFHNITHFTVSNKCNLNKRLLYKTLSNLSIPNFWPVCLVHYIILLLQMISMFFSFWRGRLKSVFSKHSWSFAEELLHLTFHSHSSCFPSMKSSLIIWMDVPQLRCWHTTSEFIVFLSEPMGLHDPSHCTSTRPEQRPRPSLKRTSKLPTISKTKQKIIGVT